MEDLTKFPPVWVIINDGKIVATNDEPCTLYGIRSIRYAPAEELLCVSLRTAFQLGQDYWRLADSDSPRQQKLAEEALAAFNKLIEAIKA